ncbi:MAG: hypothetical protein BWX66_01411 [Deltaproteobacteria bacterium ADurb.Bin058]|nr:MAG: hypothetical protein BWX66_01411 [Deltaproteobacteria bacterium ADurb.Bin058]
MTGIGTATGPLPDLPNAFVGLSIPADTLVSTRMTVMTPTPRLTLQDQRSVVTASTTTATARLTKTTPKVVSFVMKTMMATATELAVACAFAAYAHPTQLTLVATVMILIGTSTLANQSFVGMALITIATETPTKKELLAVSTGTTILTVTAMVLVLQDVYVLTRITIPPSKVEIVMITNRR